MQLSRLPVFSLAVFAAFAFGLSAPSLAEPADGEIPIEQQRAALNREQADFARRQIEENAANQRAYDASDQRFRQGIDDYLSVLDSQRSLYTAQQALVDTRRARLSNLVTLYKVLGGGWTERTVTAQAQQ